MSAYVDDVLKVVNWFRVKNFANMKLDENVGQLTQMKVMKLLYYAQGISLAAFNKELFSDEILAWKYGPVVSVVHDKYKRKRAIVNTPSDEIEEEAQNDYKDLSANYDVKVILETVQDAFGDMSAIDLMKKTHDEEPWLETEQSNVISKDLIKDYFKREIVSAG